MALKNYTTKVSAERTANEIGDLLRRHGATKVMQAYEDGHVAGVVWAIDTEHGEIGFKMPVNVEACHAVLLKQKKLVRNPEAAREQSRRTAWRIVKNWVEIQLALIETEMATLEQVMLPYAMGRDERTLYEHMRDGGYQHLLALGDGSQ